MNDAGKPINDHGKHASDLAGGVARGADGDPYVRLEKDVTAVKTEIGRLAAIAQSETRRGWRSARANVDALAANATERAGAAKNAMTAAAQDTASSIGDTLADAVEERPVASLGASIGPPEEAGRRRAEPGRPCVRGRRRRRDRRSFSLRGGVRCRAAQLWSDRSLSRRGGVLSRHRPHPSCISRCGGPAQSPRGRRHAPTRGLRVGVRRSSPHPCGFAGRPGDRLAARPAPRGGGRRRIRAGRTPANAKSGQAGRKRARPALSYMTPTMARISRIMRIVPSPPDG